MATQEIVVTKQRREVDDAGKPIQPADAIREELGIEGPRKRMMGTGVRGMLADVTF